jgi:hypothetical protein
MLRGRDLKGNRAMTGIHFVTDEKGRKVGVPIGLKKHGTIREDFWDGLISDARFTDDRKALPSGFERFNCNVADGETLGPLS